MTDDGVVGDLHVATVVDGLEFYLYCRDRGDLDNSGEPSFGRPVD